MLTDTARPNATASPATAAGPTTEPADIADFADGPLAGWHVLADATLGRPLTRAEVHVVERLSPADALDLVFPDLPDAATQEALWALG